jgi:mgtE-like transporter
MRPKHEIEEILFAEFISVTGGVLAGLGLTLFIDKLLAQPGLFILLPGLLAMRGDVSGTMAARLSMALHLHHLNPETPHSKLIRDNTIASFVLALVSGLVLGIVAFVAALLIFNVSNPSIILIAVLSAFFSTLLMLPLTTAAVVWLFMHGFEPDDVMGPYVTTIGDIIMIASLYLAVILV